MTRAQAEDREAQSELVRRYSGRIAGFVRPMVKGGDAVEDFVQLITIKMCRRLPALREAMLFESWLFMHSRTTVLDHWCRVKCRPLKVIDPTPWSEQPPAEEESGRCSKIMKEVERATLHGSAKDRRILRWVLDGASYHTIAKLEALTSGALTLRLHRLRVLLRASWRGGARAAGGPDQANDRECPLAQRLGRQLVRDFHQRENGGDGFNRFSAAQSGVGEDSAGVSDDDRGVGQR